VTNQKMAMAGRAACHYETSVGKDFLQYKFKNINIQYAFSKQDDQKRGTGIFHFPSDQSTFRWISIVYQFLFW
jgi:hypothetical protein